MAAVKTLVTCAGVKHLRKFKVTCCEYCHDHTRFSRMDHALRDYVGIGTGTDAYVCCVVLRKLQNPNWQQPAASSVVSDAIQEYVENLKTNLEAEPPLLSKLPVPASVAVCKDPTCCECAPSLVKYWSVKLQGWVNEAELELHDLFLEHPWIPGHICAPGSIKHPQKDYTVIPERRAFMCLLPTGKPTFGAKYCANPVFCAAVKEPSGVLALYLSIPTGDTMAQYVPVEYIPYVTHVNYLPYPEPDTVEDF